METIDHEARDRIAKLWTEFRELSSDYWGPNRDNGKRSDLIDIKNRLSEAEKKIKHYEDTREQSCLGLAALAKYESNTEEEEADMTKARETNKTMILMQWIQMVGIVAAAVIALLK